jgi:phosphate transport system substrate-binding protein
MGLPRLTLAGLALAALALGSCDRGESGSSSLSGRVAIDGSSTLFPFASAAAEKFTAAHPGVEVFVIESNTGGGFRRFCRDDIDISGASRPISAVGEIPVCERNGVSYREIQVALDGVSVVTNPALEIDCMTIDQLRQLWRNGSDVDSLHEIDSELPAAKLSLFAPGSDSGTFEFFTEQINGEEGDTRRDYRSSEDDNVLVRGVEGNGGGFGYFGYHYYNANQGALRAVEIDAGHGCVPPNQNSIQTGEYKPLSRPLLMYMNKRALRRREVRAFLEFVLDNHRQIAEEAGVVPMTPATAERSKTKLSN